VSTPHAPAGQPQDDHDQRFKTLLHEFLPEFFVLFLPDWAARFDFTGTEWLDQEAFLDPPGGEKRVLDVVAKVPTRVPVPDPSGRAADHSLVVLDVEVESAARTTDVRPRMLWYYEFLRRRHGLPVFPICLFLRVGLDGLGWDAYEERFWGQVLLRFEYAYIGLPALDGATYFRGDNLLGLALSALMKLPEAERARIKAEGLARIARSRENNARKELLTECFDNYLRLGSGELTEFERLKAEQFPEAGTMVNSIEERGRVRGKREDVRLLVDKKFGPLSQEVLARIESLPIERLDEILLVILDAKSLDELALGE
jgi:hypothetical protein